MAKRTCAGRVKSTQVVAAEAVLDEVRVFFAEYGCRPAKVSPLGITWAALQRECANDGAVQTLVAEMAPCSKIQAGTLKKVDGFLRKVRAGATLNESSKRWATIMRHAKVISNVSAFGLALSTTPLGGQARDVSLHDVTPYDRYYY